VTKVFWKSKTMWFNVLTGLVAFANELALVIDQIALAGWDAEKVALARAAITFVSIIGNMILRAATTSAVTLK
jgi:uncharacterized membrane protein